MFLFGNEFVERVAQNIDVDGLDGDMDIGDEFAGGPDTEDVFERRISVDEERCEGIELIEFVAGDDAFDRHEKSDDARFTVQGKVSDDTDQDESDRHQRAIGIQGVADDSDEEYRDDRPRAWSELERFVLRRLPVQEDLAISGRDAVRLRGRCS